MYSREKEIKEFADSEKKDKEIVDFIKRVLELPSSQETSTNA